MCRCCELNANGRNAKQFDWLAGLATSQQAGGAAF